jgi:hypothetical protein
MTEKRRPVHLAVLVGASASAYAITLAGVTALQSTTDARTVADREPGAHAADVMSSGNDALESSLDEATQVFEVAAGRYARLTPRLGDMETSLDALGTRVERVTGAADSLPGRVSLPRITTSTSTVTRTVTKPTVHATTGASG